MTEAETGAPAADTPGAWLITGASAAGKSTVGRALAERLGPRSAFVEGDVFWKMPVTGREDMGAAEPSAEAVRQFRLRHRAAVATLDLYAAAGFHVVHADIVLGDDLAGYPTLVRHRPLHIVVLRPSAEVVAAREEARGTNAYGQRSDGVDLRAAVADFTAWVDASPTLGLRLDSSGLTVDETIDALLDRQGEARVA